MAGWRPVVAVASRCRQRPHDVAVDHRLLPRRLHVDDRRLAGHRDGFCEGTHAHFGVDGRDAAAGQLHALAHDGGKAGKREGDRVGAGRQVGDLILPVAVGDGRAGLFDERWTRCLDGDTGQNGAGGIAHGAGESLGRSQPTCEKSETRHQKQRSRESCHGTSSVTVSLRVKGSRHDGPTVIELPRVRAEHPRQATSGIASKFYQNHERQSLVKWPESTAPRSRGERLSCILCKTCGDSPPALGR